MNIGFVGIGLMGSRIVARMLGHGYKVTIFNRTTEKTLELAGKGAIVADSISSLAQDSDVIFTMLSDAAAVEEVALSTSGLLASLPMGSHWVDVSTVGPSASKRFALAAQDKGISFIDAPVSGSTGPAERGELISLVGGTSNDLDYIKPLLETYSKRIIHAGENGMGSALKLAVNLSLCQSMVAFSELLVFSEELGLSRQMVFDTLIGGIAIAPFLGFKRQKLENHTYAPEFPLRHMAKDARLIAAEAHDGHTKGLSVTDAAISIFNSDRAKDFEDLDFSAIAEIVAEIRKFKGIE